MKNYKRNIFIDWKLENWKIFYASVFFTDDKLPRECDDLAYGSSGVYTIYPDGINAVQVYCIMANNEIWTVSFL